MMRKQELELPLKGPWTSAASMSVDFFYHLADMPSINRGLNYFLDGAITSLTYDAKSRAFRAVVHGNHDYHVMLGIDDYFSRQHCDCPAFRDENACKHVAAVAAMVFYLTQNYCFAHRPPSPEVVEPLANELLQSARVRGRRRPSPAGPVEFPNGEDGEIVRRPACITLRYTQNGTVRYGDCGLSRLHFDDKNSMVAFFEQLESAMEEVCALTSRPEYPLRLREKVQPLGLDVAVVVEDGRALRLNGLDETRLARWVVNLDAALGVVALIKGGQDALPEGALAFGPNHFVQDDGTFVMITAPARNRVTDLIARNNIAYFLRSDVPPGPVGHRSLDEFNRDSLFIPGNELRRALSDTNLTYHNEPAAIADFKAPAPVSACLSFGPGRTEAQASVQISLMGGDFEIPLDGLVQRLRRILSAERIDRQLMSAKGRVQTLTSAANRLLLAESKYERSQVVQETLAQRSLSDRTRKRQAKKWLNQFIAEFVQTGRQWHLLATPRGWRACQSPRRLLAQLLLGLNTLVDEMSIHEVSAQWEIPRVDLPQYLDRATMVCAACGAKLRYNDLEIERMPLEVYVEASQDDRIDWFELRAEVSCGRFSIPQTEWERLIRGELILEREGRLIVPELDQAEAVARLNELLVPARQREKRQSAADQAAMSVPRLQMLEWLELRRLGVRVKLPQEAERIFERLRDFKSIPGVELPGKLDVSLRDYQKKGFEWLAWLYQNRFGACLADDMGLGKTIQAIVFLAWVKERRDQPRSSLVVMPPSLIFNWRHEIERFAPKLTVADYVGGDRDLDKARRADVMLTTYDLARRDIEMLKEIHFDVVVLDEVQALKNIAAVRTKATARLQRRFTLCLTGTPMENHVGEYYSIMHLALPGIFGEYSQFRKRVKTGDRALLRRARPFVLRRTKGQILTELPPKVESEICLDMTDEQKEIYTRTVGEVREEVRNAYAGKTQAQAGIAALAALMRLRQVCVSPELLGIKLAESAPKIAYLTDKMRELQDEGYAGLFFSQFTRTLDLIETAAGEEDLRVLRLDGSTPTRKRKQLVETFQEAEEPHLFLVSLRAGGVGLNLTRAQYVFHIDPWWNPAVEQQASDRAHRIGQQSTVFVQRLIMRHSVEEKIMELKRRKQALFEAIVEEAGSEASRGSLITQKDFEFLLGA